MSPRSATSPSTAIAAAPVQLPAARAIWTTRRECGTLPARWSWQMFRIFPILLAMTAATVATAAGDPKPAPDDAFRAAAKQFESASRRQLVAWGTVRLDGTAHRYRFAALEATGKQPNGALESVCGDPDHSVGCRGAYLIEQATGKLWVIGFSDNRWGPTRAFHRSDADDGKDPPFEAADEEQLVHSQMHNHGTEVLGIGFRGGRLAMIEIHDSNRQGDDDRVCKSKKVCPALATFSYELVDYVHFTVAGPFKSVDEIRESPAPDEY
jgi:hypothetical protein